MARRAAKPAKKKASAAATEREPDGRFAPGAAPQGGESTRFGKGNQAAKGHGRPPDAAKMALSQILDEVRDDVKSAAGKEGRGLKEPGSIVELATLTLVRAMQDRDLFGCVTPAGVQAARAVYAYRFGLPKQTTQLNISGAATIGLVRGRIAIQIAQDASAAKAAASE